MDGEHLQELLPLTTKQRAVYSLATRYYFATGEPCSLAWLARRLHKNRNTIHDRVRAIVRKGWATAQTPAFRRLTL